MHPQCWQAEPRRIDAAGLLSPASAELARTQSEVIEIEMQAMSPNGPTNNKGVASRSTGFSIRRWSCGRRGALLKTLKRGRGREDGPGGLPTSGLARVNIYIMAGATHLGPSFARQILANACFPLLSENARMHQSSTAFLGAEAPNLFLKECRARASPIAQGPRTAKAAKVLTARAGH